MVDLAPFLILVILGAAALALGTAATLDFERLTADLERQTGDTAVRTPRVRLLLRATFVLFAAVGAGFIVLGFLLGFGVDE